MGGRQWGMVGGSEMLRHQRVDPSARGARWWKNHGGPESRRRGPDLIGSDPPPAPVDMLTCLNTRNVYIPTVFGRASLILEVQASSSCHNHFNSLKSAMSSRTSSRAEERNVWITLTDHESLDPSFFPKSL